MSLFLTGQRLTADLLNAQLEPSTCFLVQQVAQTGWTTATPTAITFGAGSTTLDTDAIHSESSNTSRLVIGKKLGWWEISGEYCAPSNNVTLLVRAIIYKNGNPIFGSFNGVQLAATTSLIGAVTPTIEVQATAATDYVELMGYQTAASGAIGTAFTSPYVACSVRATWKRP